MPDMLDDEMRKSAARKTSDKKTGRLARMFCEQCFQMKDVQIVDDRRVVGPGLDFDFMDELSVISVVGQMCDAYGLTIDIDKHKDNWVITINNPNNRTFTGGPSATSPILRRAMLQAAIYGHSTWVEPAFRRPEAQAATAATKQMLLPQFDIPGCSVSIEYPANLTGDEFELLRSKIDSFMRRRPDHDDE
jgi:hypothetical protein